MRFCDVAGTNPVEAGIIAEPSWRNSFVGVAAGF
jgi:hypothetical protein